MRAIQVEDAESLKIFTRLAMRSLMHINDVLFFAYTTSRPSPFLPFMCMKVPGTAEISFLRFLPRFPIKYCMFVPFSRLSSCGFCMYIYIYIYIYICTYVHMYICIYVYSVLVSIYIYIYIYIWMYIYIYINIYVYMRISDVYLCV